MATSNRDSDGSVSVGEVTIQFAASDPAGKKEVRELNDMIAEQLRSMENAKVVTESYTLDDFDRSLSWDEDGDSDE